MKEMKRKSEEKRIENLRSTYQHAREEERKEEESKKSKLRMSINEGEKAPRRNRKKRILGGFIMIGLYDEKKKREKYYLQPKQSVWWGYRIILAQSMITSWQSIVSLKIMLGSSFKRRRIEKKCIPLRTMDSMQCHLFHHDCVDATLHLLKRSHLFNYPQLNIIQNALFI